jgi:hypothetical protein
LPASSPRPATPANLPRSRRSSLAEQIVSRHIGEINRFSDDALHRVLASVLEHDLHAKRVDSLGNVTLGVLDGASLAVSAKTYAVGTVVCVRTRT